MVDDGFLYLNYILLRCSARSNGIPTMCGGCCGIFFHFQGILLEIADLVSSQVSGVMVFSGRC